MLIQCSQLLSSIASFPGFPAPKQGMSIFVGLQAQTSESQRELKDLSKLREICVSMRVSVR